MVRTSLVKQQLFCVTSSFIITTAVTSTEDLFSAAELELSANSSLCNLLSYRFASISVYCN